MHAHRLVVLMSLVVSAAVVAACGGSSASTGSSAAGSTASQPGTAGAAAPTVTTAPATTADAPVGALTAEAASAASGDIPDNQVFLVFDDPAGGWSMKYPEGWAQNGSARDVTFQDKNNLVRVAVRAGAAPTVASVAADLAALKASQPTLRPRTPTAVTIHGTPMIRAVYQLASAPNPVTGKRVTLVVDRYVTAQNGRVAVVDLGTPVGVDNVDAYRLMIDSFRWR